MLKKIHFKMHCLRGKEAVASTTENGNFWICGQYPKCQFICSEDDGYLYDKAIQAFLATNQVLPKCCVLGDSDDPQECNFAKIWVVKDPEKESYGRPFFRCSKKDDRCDYFEWGDETIIQKPLCKHGKRCKVWKVKKEGRNQGRSFVKCPQRREEQCDFFEWFDPTPVPNPVGKNDETYRSIYTPNYYTDYSCTTPIEYTARPKRMRMK